MKKIKVPNISFLEYVELDDKTDYNYYLFYGEFKPLDIFKLGDFTDQDFGFVKDMQDYMNSTGLSWQDFFKEMAIKTKKKETTIARMSLFKLQQGRVYIKEQIERINKLENDNLSHTPSHKETSAGIDGFAKFRSFIQFDKLAGGDILKYDEVRKVPYGTCFTKLLLDAETNEFQIRVNKAR